jgi:rubrerythrin
MSIAPESSTTSPKPIVPRGELRCAECGYGISVRIPPHACPMCRSRVWEPSPWRPFTKAGFARSA